MSRTIDRIFGSLMILGMAGHTTGTFLGYPFLSQIFVWSIGTSLAGALLGFVNLQRASRPDDRVLRAVAAAGNIVWILICLGFGKSIGNLADPRVIFNVVIAGALLFFSVVTARASVYGRPVTTQG